MLLSLIIRLPIEIALASNCRVGEGSLGLCWDLYRRHALCIAKALLCRIRGQFFIFLRVYLQSSLWSMKDKVSARAFVCFFNIMALVNRWILTAARVLKLEMLALMFKPVSREVSTVVFSRHTLSRVNRTEQSRKEISSYTLSEFSEY